MAAASAPAPGGARDRFLFMAEAMQDTAAPCLTRILEELPPSNLLAACGVSRSWRLCGASTEAYERSLVVGLSPNVACAWLGHHRADTTTAQALRSPAGASSLIAPGSTARGVSFEGREELETKLRELQVSPPLLLPSPGRGVGEP